ncbi:MAG: hypothetical protein JWN84_3051 [Nocardioides sp.]|nr:hypothetical protein [Nocardioides sp.]
MSNHRRSTTRKTRRTGRARAVLSLGAIGVLATGMSVQGTFAFWTDDATAQTGTFTSGSLDITLNGALTTAGLANNPGRTTLSELGLADMAPGESRAFAFPIVNAGTVGLTYTISGSATGALSSAMRFTVATGAAGNASANGLRTGTCANAAISATPNQTLPSTTPATIAPVVSAARPLAPGATETICVIARLDSATLNDRQLQTMTADLIFNAKQVGAP